MELTRQSSAGFVTGRNQLRSLVMGSTRCSHLPGCVIFSNNAMPFRGGPGEVRWLDFSQAGVLAGRWDRKKKKNEGICNKGMVVMSNGGQEGLMGREKVKGPVDWRCRGHVSKKAGKTQTAGLRVQDVQFRYSAEVEASGDDSISM